MPWLNQCGKCGLRIGEVFKAPPVQSLESVDSGDCPLNTVPNFNVLASYEYFYLAEDSSFEVSLSQDCGHDSGISGHLGIKVCLTVDSHPSVQFLFCLIYLFHG